MTSFSRYVCTVSCSIILSTRRCFVAAALSPAFSNASNVLRISLWSFLRSTMASVDMGFLLAWVGFFRTQPQRSHRVQAGDAGDTLGDAAGDMVVRVRSIDTTRAPAP